MFNVFWFYSGFCIYTTYHHLKENQKYIPIIPSDMALWLILISGNSNGVIVLGILPVPGHPTNLDDSRARAYCACNRCGWAWFGHFFSRLSFHFSFCLPVGDDPI